MPQQLQSDDISVETLFRDSFYVVPDFQREYIWERAQVEQLLTDILDEIPANPQAPRPEYFIGSIVVCPNEQNHGLLNLIDGQQRLTTLYVTLCAIRDHLHENHCHTYDDDISRQLYASRTDELGRKTKRPRLVLQYEDSGEALVRLEQKESILDVSTRSTKNIKNAYETALDFFGSFRNDVDAVSSYYGYLNNKVKLIQIHTSDVGESLKIFETINDRGMGLDAMDLLKNLLFRQVKGPFEDLKKRWWTLQKEIHSMREKPLRFIRYFALSNYDEDDIDKLREDKVYRWFKAHDSTVKYSERPLAFTDELVTVAKAYGNYRQGRDHRGREHRTLQNLKILGGSATRQHLLLLLAGRHLGDDSFGILASEIENLLFCYMITREPARTWERKFAQWASVLRNVRSSDELNSFLRKSVTREKADLANRFADAMGRLKFGDLQKYRARYILSKFVQHFEISARGLTHQTGALQTYLSRDLDVEHIYPLTPDGDVERESGSLDDPDLVHRFGNLMLIESQINKSVRNRPYSEKRLKYPGSTFILNKAIVGPLCVKSFPRRVVDVAATVPSFESWNEEAINTRQRWLARLAHKVWDVPEPKVEPAP